MDALKAHSIKLQKYQAELTEARSEYGKICRALEILYSSLKNDLPGITLEEIRLISEVKLLLAKRDLAKIKILDLNAHIRLHEHKAKNIELKRERTKIKNIEHKRRKSLLNDPREIELFHKRQAIREAKRKGENCGPNGNQGEVRINQQDA